MSSRGVLTYLKSRSRYNMTPQEVEQYQTKKLRLVMRYASQNNSVWRETFKSSGFNPEDITSPAELRKLPTATKADMMKVQDAARAAGLLEGTKVVTSTGTTGEPMGFARGSGRGTFNKAISYRTQVLHGLRPWSRVVTLWAPQKYWKKELQDDGSSKPYTGIYNNPLWRFRGALNLMTMWVNPMDPVGDGKILSDFNPEIIYGRPAYLRRIARYCGSDLKVRPRLIEAAGEILTKTGLKELHDAYGAKVVRAYGSSDCGKLGADCLYETGIHTWEDFRVYEVLKDGEPVSPGEVGELVVTHLEIDAIPFIRFRTGDYVRLAEPGRCECGCYMRRLSAIEGRENDWIVGKDGARFLSLEVADHLESEFGLRDFQLLQNGSDAFTLLLREDDLNRHPDVSNVQKYLEGIVGAPVVLEIKQRSDDDYWVKTRPVICRIGRS